MTVKKIVSEKLVLNGQEIFSFSGGKLSVTNLSGIKERDALIRLFFGVSTELYLLKLKDYMGGVYYFFPKIGRRRENKYPGILYLCWIGITSEL